MARQEVEVFFKVEGIDGYITDLDNLKSALGNVDDATQAATRATEELIDETQDLEQFEQRIATLEGSVKLLAGSAEFAAGAIGLLGDENNEFFQAVEENVINVVALAQGAIDISEGYRLLTQNTKLAAQAQRILNTVAKANPYVLLASAIVAAAGALLLFKSRAEEAEQAARDARREYEKLAEEIRNSAQADLDSFEAKQKLIEAQEEVTELTRDEINTRRDALIAEKEAAKAAVEAAAEKLRREKEANEIVGAGFRSIGFVKKAQEELDAVQKTYTDTLNAANAELSIYNDELERRNDATQKAIDLQRQQQAEEDAALERLEPRTAGEIQLQNDRQLLIRQTGEVAEEVNEQVKGLTVDQADRITNFTDVAEGSLDDLSKYTASTFSFLSDLNTLFTKDDEERQKKAFKINKAAQLANAIVTGALAVNKAFASQIIPGDPTSLPRAIGAAALAGVQTAAQVAVIARQKYQDQSSTPPPGLSNSFNGGGGFTPPPPDNVDVDLGLGLEGEATITAIGQGQNAPVRTYVVAGDVTTAQEADKAIEDLATL